MFITFEGLDCSGKSTQIKQLNEYLISNGFKTYLTKQTGGEESVKEIREILLNKKLDPITQVLLIYADRIEHMKTISKYLKDDYIVLCDRYVDSTYAYQCFGFDVDSSLIQKIHSLTNLIIPDLTIYLSITPEESLKRLKSRASLDIIETNSNLEFIKKLETGYKTLILNNPKRIKVIDSLNLSISQTHLLTLRNFNEVYNYLKGNRIEDKNGSIPPLVQGREENITGRLKLPE